MISKTLFRNLFTCKGTYMIDWVGRRVLWRVAVYCSVLPISSASIEPPNVVQQCVWLCMHSDSIYGCNMAATRALGMWRNSVHEWGV